MFSIDFPSLAATDLVDDAEIQKLAREVDSIGEVRGGVASVGDAAAYALVWEWGNVRQTKKGPKTVMGINPDGERVWLTIQAPEGYIRVNTPAFLNALDQALASVSFRNLTAKALKDEIINANLKASKKIVLILRQHAPEDSGDLKESFTVLSPDDDALKDFVEENDLSAQDFGGVYQDSSDMFE